MAHGERSHGQRRFPRMVAPGRRLGRRLSRARCASGRCAPQTAAGRDRRADRRRRRRKRPSRWRRSSPISSETIVPGMTHWQHPRFFAYFPANAAPVSVVAEYLVSRHGRAMHAVADLAGRDRTRDEDDRLAAPGARPARRLFRRHPGFGLVGDARRRADHARAGAGLAGQPDRACRPAAPARSIAPTRSTPRSTAPSGSSGIGEDNLVRIPTGGRWRSHGCRQRWKRRSSPTAPPACCRPASSPASAAPASAAPTTSRPSRAIARKHGLYLHVDAAWAGSAMICPEFRHFWAGVEQADSIVFNPHKWLGAQFDCSVHFVRDPESLVRTLAIQPEYLKTHGTRRHRQLFRMVGAARPPVPRAETLVPAPRARAGRPARP